MSTICIFRIFYIGDLSSCQFRDLPITNGGWMMDGGIVNGEKIRYL